MKNIVKKQLQSCTCVLTLNRRCCFCNFKQQLKKQFSSKTHLQNTFFGFLSRFVRVWLKSFKKCLYYFKKHFFQKGIWVANKEFEMLILKPLKTLQIELCEKSFQQKSDRKMEFFTFITVCWSLRPINSFGWIFNWFKLSIKFCELWYPHRIFAQIFLAYISTFCQARTKWLIKRKRVLKSHFTSIFGLGGSIL